MANEDHPILSIAAQLGRTLWQRKLQLIHWSNGCTGICNRSLRTLDAKRPSPPFLGVGMQIATVINQKSGR